MTKPGRKSGSLGTIALVVPLFAILIGASWYAARAWMSIKGPPMPTAGYVAMSLGVIFSLVIGFGLMALLFYSSRQGYDDIGYEDRHRSATDSANDNE